jgi:predicted metalloendopeptidase
MPDREYYVSDASRMVDLRAAFKSHVAKMLSLAGVANADAASAGVVALEGKMAAAHATRLESLAVRSANNPWKRTEFASKAPGLDWQTFFATAGLDTQPVIIVWHPAAVTKLSGLVASEPLATWKQWLTFHAIDRRANELPAAFVDARFAFHGQALTGAPQLADRWKRSVGATNAAMGDAVGRLYVARYFPPAARARVQALVRNLIDAFGSRIDRLDWMSAATKAKASEKLATLLVGVGYPDKWTDYSALDVVRGDALGNAERAERFAYKQSLAKAGTSVDKGEWWITPQTVNALNLPLQNAMNFPAAILAPPFFDPDAPAAVNYGAIGSVIGHEISHSFDDQGALFDAQGRLANWWTEEDFAHFEASGKQLAAQYDQYQPFPDLHVNGRQTLSENIGDLAGLATAYDAWQRSLGGAPAPTVEGFSGAQQFFMSFAQSWRNVMREPALRQQIITDGHAPSQYRTATVRNLDAWYDAFGVKPGQKLYLPPGDRVRVW